MTATTRDPLVETAVRNWALRFVAQGVDYNDFVQTTEPIKTWEEWLDAWVANGDRHLERARVAEERGRTITAGEAYVHASMSYHFGVYLWLLDESRYREVTLRSVDALLNAYRLLDPTHERLEIPFRGGQITGNFRRPEGEGKSLLALLIPGLDSTKEEFFHWEEVFLARGIATLSLDGPGQGESGFKMGFIPEYEEAVGAALDALAHHADHLHLDRVGITGTSLGGYYAPRSAAFEPRIKAAVAVGGPYNLGAYWDNYPPMIVQKLKYSVPTDSEDEARKRALDFSLDGVASQIECPLLVVHGDRDWAFPWQDAKRMADEAPRGELALFKGSGHCLPDIPYIYKPLVADWMKEKLSETA